MKLAKKLSIATAGIALTLGFASVSVPASATPPNPNPPTPVPEPTTIAGTIAFGTGLVMAGLKKRKRQ